MIKSQVKQARLPTDRKEAAAAAGDKLHTWLLKETKDGTSYYRCAVCDWPDQAKAGHTPDAHQPFCPAGPGMI